MLTAYQIYRTLLSYFLIKCVDSKLTLPNLDSVGLGSDSGKLNDCQRCKLLTDSFKHWFDKTSRGKFEGGDAAWEEAKLKSYTRSEIRLVEIQEGLCSELKRNQDQCYSIAEDAEQPLEKWWFNEDQYSDLYSWLCIETLQYCCPQHHFGPTCEHCIVDKDNKICSSHGKCDGEGTRFGNGTCLCYKGFSGRYCEECAQNYFLTKNGKCESCHRSCDGCSGRGPENCSRCKPGWQTVSGVCTDINECDDPNICKQNQYCVNREGSYICKACDKTCSSCVGPGPNNCSSCGSNYLLLNQMCITEQQKNNFTASALKTTALYAGLLLLSLFASKVSKTLTSFFILVVAVYIYYSEKISSLKTFDVIYYAYF